MLNKERPVSIVGTFANVENDTFTIVFDTSKLRVQIVNENESYPEGTFFITLRNSMELRYAVIPCDCEKPISGKFIVTDCDK